MKYTLSQKLDKQTLARFFKDAWNAEVSSNVQANYELFQNIWKNIDEDPTFEEYDDLDRAQLFRFYGFFLSHYGQARSLPFYQERGKNLLTKAIDLFNSLNLPESAAEAEVGLGLCYFYEGAISESEAVYEHIISNFSENQLHPVCLRAKINSTLVLQWKVDYQKALQIFEEIEIPMEFCSDPRLLICYHNQAGLIYRGCNQFDRAIYHYNRCIEVSQQDNNWLVVSKNHNNLAFLNKILGNFDLAHYHVERAIEIAQKIQNLGFLPNFIDTKALILFEQGKFEAALETINQAISIFRQGDDYANLIDALWNKSKSLLSLNRKDEAVETFAELSQIAQVRIGEFAVKRYSKLFAEIIHVKQGGSLEKEVQRFKKFEVVSALRRSNYNFLETAKSLSLADSEQLISILDKEFPEVYEELGIRQPSTKPEINFSPKAKRTKSESHNPKQINKIELHEVNFQLPAFTDKSSQSKITAFYVSGEIMEELFAVDEDAVLAVAPAQNLAAGDVVLAKTQDKEYILNIVRHDKSLDIFYLLDNDEPFPLEEITLIGQTVGYCLFTEIDKADLFFEPLPAFRR